MFIRRLRVLLAASNGGRLRDGRGRESDRLNTCGACNGGGEDGDSQCAEFRLPPAGAALQKKKKKNEKNDLALPGSLTSEILVMQKKNPDTLQHTDCEKWNRRPSCYGTRIRSCIQLLFFCSAKTDNLFFLNRKTAHRKTVDGLFYFYTHALLKTVHSQQL